MKMCAINLKRLFWCTAALWALGAAAPPGQAETITLDGSRPGRIFEGLGGLSAGAGSRLLFDYPEPHRSQLLDFLFKPNFGAAFHHLKVEIGGDVNSTEGSEPSYARSRNEFEHPRREYFERGYEWWLMCEAKKRNPKIQLDILQWGAPDWIGDREFPDSGDPTTLAWQQRIPRDRKKFFTQDNADFIAGFIRGARKYHGLTIDYCGTWNETPADNAWKGPALDVPWIKLLRKTLDDRGLAGVKIIARDCGWRIADLMEQDAALNDAIYAVGVHYPGHQSSPAAQRLGKPLWASEDHAGWAESALCNDAHPGFAGSLGWVEARALARLYNLNYITGRMTKTTICYLINSYYDSLSFAKCGAIRACEPWSGHYEVWLPLWSIAHTTQFAQPGWRYLDGACGALAGGGSYVALRSPESRGDYSIIVETGDAKKRQTLAFRLTGGLAGGTVHVWRSNEQRQFECQEDIHPIGNSFSVNLEPDCIYTLTTTTGQRKGHVSSPPSTDFPMPYQDDFKGYRNGKTARYFADQSGTFEVATSSGGSKCLRQTVARRGIDWEAYPTPEPYTIIGSAHWCDYEVSCDASIEGTGYAAVFGRIKASLLSCQDPPYGYWLKAGSDGRWELKAFKETLASGACAISTNHWHKLALRFSGSRITASIDSVVVKDLDHDSDLVGFSEGMAGLGTGWNNAQFSHFSVRPVAGTDARRHANLAQSGKAAASSNYSAAYSARFAADGNPATRWNSAVGDGNGAWLEIEFSQPARFNRIAVRQFDKRIEQYKIQYLDGAQWRDAFTGRTTEECWTATFTPVLSTRVRLLVTASRDNITPSIFEFAVYDQEDSGR